MNRSRACTSLALAAGLLALAGCDALRRGPGAPQAPPDAPAVSASPARAGERPAPGPGVYRVDPGASEVRVLVGRGGRLARLGHDHVVAVVGLGGEVDLREPLADSVARLTAPVAGLVLDDPRHRVQLGLDTTPSVADVEATRRNMLGERGLDAERHPELALVARVAQAQGPLLRLAVDVTLRGVTRRVESLARLEDADGALAVTGALDLDQTAFGIEPYAVLGGALRVEDRLRVTYRVVARRA